MGLLRSIRRALVLAIVLAGLFAPSWASAVTYIYTPIFNQTAINNSDPLNPGSKTYAGPTGGSFVATGGADHVAFSFSLAGGAVDFSSDLNALINPACNAFCIVDSLNGSAWTFDVAAGSSTATMRFDFTGPLAGGSVSKALMVSAPSYAYQALGTLALVPEPASWAMMLIGFAAIGAVMRRRRPVFAAA